MSKQLLLALGAGGAAAAAVVASAATIGGVNSTDLGADTGVVASCDTGGIDVSYTTAFADGVYEVTSVTLAGVSDACATQDVSITLYGASNTALGSASGTIPVDAVPLTPNDLTDDYTVGTPPDAEAVTGVAVVISG
ncbi:MAG TPA: hypothetical protein VGE43_10360 [Acidimicrobiales bacterium]